MPTPRGYPTPVSGDSPNGPAQILALATAVDTDVGNIATRLYTPPVAHFTKTTLQSIATATYVAVLWDTESIDLPAPGGHSTVSNTSRYVAPVTGYYRVDCQVRFANFTTGIRDIVVRANGAATNYLHNHHGGGGPSAEHCLGTSGNVPVLLTGGAGYLEVYAQQTSGGALNLSGGGGSNGDSFFSVTWVSS